MRILLRHRFGPYRAALSIGRVTDVQGVNSELADGQHCLMWEFDGSEFAPVYAALMGAQAAWALPRIIIARSHPEGGFHAYCFQRATWLRSLSIVASTDGVDPAWINLCAMRGHWTLRLTDKGQGAPLYHSALPSMVPDTCSMLDLVRYVKYEAHTTKKIWGIGFRGQSE